MASSDEQSGGRRRVVRGHRRTFPGTRRRIVSIAVAVLVLLLAGTGVVDQRGQQYADGVFQQALVTFAAARTLDAAISVAQGTELALQPAGLGVTLTAGELLDPVNDLVEQFASVMLISTISLGVQNLLLRASAWWVLTVSLAVILVAHVGLQWSRFGLSPAAGRRARELVGKVLAVLLVVRFAMPVVAIGSALLFQHFLAPSQSESVEALEATSTDIRQMERLDESAAELARPGLLERMTTWFRSTVEEMDVSERIAAFRERISGATEHVIHLIVVFTLQTILLPLGFLWLLPRVFGLAIDRLS